MNRRTLLQTTAITTLGLIMSSAPKSFATEPELEAQELQLTGLITNNHGHVFTTLTLTQTILILQQIHKDSEKPSLVSIKGTSGHDHILELTTSLLLELLTLGQIETVTQPGANHTHPVMLQLAEI